MPISPRASVKTMGISVPALRALRNTAAISAGGISSPPRYRSIRASSASMTLSISCVWASATSITGDSPALFSMQSMTAFLSAVGRLAQRHREPKVSWIVWINSGNSMFSASILLMMITRGWFASLVSWKNLRVLVSMPEGAPMTSRAVSAAGMETIAGPIKSG
jgi:hypothetical protein